jgi:peptidoglycan/LPS O-acetylase OafA/YrhL
LVNREASVIAVVGLANLDSILNSHNHCDMPPDSHFRTDIEGLRGIAVLLVVAFHCGLSGFRGGFIGVDVFFVLSGYLITGLLVNEVERTGRVDLVRFYARRMRRLLPAAVLVGLVTVGVGALILAPDELRNAGRAARANSVYLSNMLFARDAADYFAASVKTNPMLHTWSLAVEEQFYFIWPLLVIFALQLCRSRKILLWVLSAMTAVSLVASIELTAKAPTFAFYGLPTRAWEFGLGGLAMLMPTTLATESTAAWKTLSWIGFITILASANLVSERLPFPGAVALIPVLGTVVALVAAAARPHIAAGRLLDSPPMQLLGRLSYSWYLWHWPFLVLLLALLPNASSGTKSIAAVLALGAAAVTHRLFENPIRFHPALVRRPGRSLALGGALMLTLFAVSTGAIHFADGLAASPEMQRFSVATEDIADMPRQKCVSLGNSTAVMKCTFGADSSSIRIVLFGDSHAIQWFNAVRAIAEARAWSLTTFLKSGCPAADVEPTSESHRVGVCEQWRGAAMREIQSTKPTLVIVASSTTYLGRKGDPEGPARLALSAWREGTRRTLDAFSSANLNVVLLRDTPLPGFNVPACLARSARHLWYPSNGCIVERSLSLNPSTVERSLIAQPSASPRHLLDFTDQFCAGETCATLNDGVVVYRDDSHITGAFATKLRTVFEARLLVALHVREPYSAPGPSPAEKR